MEQKDEKQNSWQKRQLVIALIATALLALMVGTLAWLTYIRKLQTVTMLDMPNLIIHGPYGSASAPIELGDIDVTSNVTSRQYVFSITAVSADYYKLQLAHTTNVPFRYTIYNAAKNDSQGIYASGYYYADTGALRGNYLNAIDGVIADTDATEPCHVATYEGYQTVQQNARPMYWQSAPVKVTDDRDYYILEVSWDSGLQNNRETDIVYLTVETVTESTTQTTGEGT